MDYMLALLDTHSSDFLFRELFLRQLPEQVRVALANSSITDPRGLAKEADKFFTATRHTGAAAWHPEPSAAAPRPPPPPAELTPLAATTAAMPRRPHPLRPPEFPPGRTVCYYHARFGRKARTCRPPCTFNGSGNDQADGRSLP